MDLTLIDSIFNWFEQHPSILLWLGGSSLFIFIFSILGVSWLVSQIPETYFLHKNRQPQIWKSKFPLLRLITLMLKNIIGVLLIIGGLMMLVLPGQGLITLVTGFLFIDYPGKYKLERRLVASPLVLKSLNWIRKKSNKPRLKI